ncbi:MAG: hypothetical protein ACJ8R9_05545 [Steroidobacteraceae bacterium]
MHGTPITPGYLLDQLAGGSFCVSHSSPHQLHRVMELLAPHSLLLLDNGAFSRWKAGRGVIDREHFWLWANEAQELCELAIAVIPDVIGGAEDANWREASCAVRSSLSAYPERCMFIWHMNESFEGLARAARLFNFVGIGSCAQFDVQRYPERYRERLRHASAVLDYVELFHGRRPFVHLMRGLGVLHQFTRFDSADSTNIARNHHLARNEPRHVAALAARIEGRIRRHCIAGGVAHPTSNFEEGPSESVVQGQSLAHAHDLLRQLVERIQHGDTRWLNLNATKLLDSDPSAD